MSKKRRCSFEKMRRSGAAPVATSCTVALLGTPFIEPEHTKPPGIASTSTLKLREVRHSSGSSVGTTGRSLTTVSSPFPWTRRALTTTPALWRASVGVSKK